MARNYYRFTGVSSITKLPVHHYEGKAEIKRGHLVAMDESRFNTANLSDRFEYVGPVDEIQVVTQSQAHSGEDVDLSLMSAGDAANFITSLATIQEVSEAVQAEKEGKNRKTVLAAAEQRTVELASG